MNPEKLYEAIKDLPESSVQEVLDFAEFLRARHSSQLPGSVPAGQTGDQEQQTSFAERINRRFRDLDAGDLPIPARGTAGQRS